jgi:hypothetical protein
VTSHRSHGTIVHVDLISCDAPIEQEHDCVLRSPISGRHAHARLERFDGLII